MATTLNSHFTGHTTDPETFKPNNREVEALGQALKNPEFRAMLCDYVKEVQDPANRELYMREMTQLEESRGYRVTFLAPKPGYVIKTLVLNGNNKTGSDKVFINVCSDENVEDASADFKARGSTGQVPWSVPFSTSKPRQDVDKSGLVCTVYDVIFHPNVIKKTASNFQFRQMVNTTALEGIEKAFGLKLDRKRMRFPKLKFKGSSHLSVIRNKIEDEGVETSEKTVLDDSGLGNSQAQEHRVLVCEKQDVGTKEPKYVIKYRYEQRDLPLNNGSETDPCRPSSMVVEISLPEMSSAKGIDLDVLEYLLTLESSEPVAYKLVLKLPYPVNEDQGSAKFDKTLKTLNVTLPVNPKKPVSRLVSVDSGIGLEFDEVPTPEDHQDDPKAELVRNSLEKSDEKDLVDRSLPPYTCHIYEGLMVVTIAVRNVVADSLDKALLKDQSGFKLVFHTLGQGFVQFNYGFCLAFDSVQSCSLDDLEVEVWDNNMILQLTIPKNGCQNYRVGCHQEDLGEPIALPQLEAFKEKCFLLGKKNGSTVKAASNDDLDSDDSNEDKLNKERHSSGESNDSAVSFSEPPSPTKTREAGSPSTRFLVIPSDFGKCENSANLRGILKRPRCLSDSGPELMRMMSSPAVSTSSTILEEDDSEISCEIMGSHEKRSVRFNEVVQRQVYRTNSSILGQKHKNQKRAEQKRRKAARRASEGDTPNSFSNEESDNDITYHGNQDSGCASSVEESGSALPEKEVNKKKNNAGNKRNNSKMASKFLSNEQGSNSDLIFSLDF